VILQEALGFTVDAPSLLAPGQSFVAFPIRVCSLLAPGRDLTFTFPCSITRQHPMGDFPDLVVWSFSVLAGWPVARRSVCVHRYMSLASRTSVAFGWAGLAAYGHRVPWPV
jgi:hypothetical protein